jgi:hypothetical protein
VEPGKDKTLHRRYPEQKQNRKIIYTINKKRHSSSRERISSNVKSQLANLEAGFLLYKEDNNKHIDV